MGVPGAWDLRPPGGFAARPAWMALFLCAVSLAATLTIAVWAWRRRATASAATPFAAMALAQAAWNAGHLAELASAGLAAKVAWDCFETLPAVATGFFMLLFAARYTGRRVPRWLLAVIGVALAVPTLVIVAAPATAGGALRASATLEPPYGALVYDFTSWDVAYLAALLAVALAAVGLLVGLLLQQRAPFRAQTAGVAFAIAFPLFFGFTWLALDLRLQGERDISHVAFAVSSLVTAWTLARGRLFDLVPVAREAVFEHLTDAVLVVDRAGRIIDANPVAEALLHTHTAGGVGKAAVEVLEPWPDLVGLIGSEEARQQEVSSPSSFGRRWYDARWAPLRDRVGRWLGGTLVLRDVSTLRQARTVLEQQVQKGSEALAVSEGRFRTLFDETFQLIGLVDRDGTLLAANRAALQMIDAQLPSVLGRPLWETPWWTHDAGQQARLRESLARAADGEFVRFDATHVDGKGKRRAIDFSLMPVRDARGEVVQIIPEGRDVTAVQEAHARAAALTARLQQAEKLEAIGRVAAGVAHDFNNLLTVISASIDVARRELPAGSPAVALLGEALQAVDSAAGVTRQLLTFSRKQPASPRRLSIAETLAPVEAMLRRLARPSTIPPPRLPDDLWAIFMDPAQLQQAVMNLIVNARDAMPNGGAIVISGRNVSAANGTPAPRARPSGEFVRLDVSDAGQGMTEEVRAHVFEPFFTTKPEGEGTGLGLAVVQGAVTASGGFVEVDSAPGAGTTVSLFLPRARD
ncbi:MAG TPA: histidine kinase N-terminal 7TM domain-containing protein [Polyangia bacterium]|nr:histidine kinase N-terminal 7TM domain-containing protein [Polyangia bacterium]